MPQIPAGWEETTLGEVLILNYGKGLTVEKRINGTIPVYWSSWITGYHNQELVWWPWIIIWRKWSVGKVYFSKQSFYPIDTVYYILPDKNYDLIFIYNLLLTLGLDKMNSDSAVPWLNRDNAYALPIHLPPLPEQQAIAAVLSSFDDKIELLRAENQTLEQMGQELFKERFGKWKVGDELPEGWRVGKITEIIRRESISYKCDKKDLDDKGLTPILDQGSTGLYGYTSRDPDFIATKDSPVIIFTNHTCNFWFIDYPFCAIQNVLPYRWINGYDVYFLYFMTKGSIKFTEYKWHRPSFVALDFVIPPVELAQEFSKIAERILNKILWNKEQIQSLSATRDQLLPKLMSGEVRVEF